MFGENNSEYGNDLDDNFKPEMDKKFFSNQNIDKIYLGGESITNIIKNYDFNLNDLPLHTSKVRRIKKIE